MFDTVVQDIDRLKHENSELKRSLEFTQDELLKVQREVGEQRNWQRETMRSDAAEGNIAERVRILEDHSRRNNIIVEGLPEKENENKEILQASVRELLNKKLDVNPPSDDMHRLGKKAGKKPRPVLIKLKSHGDKQDCIRAAPRLKGTNIYINDDVSTCNPTNQKIKDA